jgi:hypothetical protein
MYPGRGVYLNGLDRYPMRFYVLDHILKITSVALNWTV